MISESERLFETYRLARNWDKYEIDIRNDDTIKRNQIFFDFMKKTFNCLDGLYLHERFLFIYTIMEYQSRKWSVAEIVNQTEKKSETKERKVHITLLKKTFLWIREPGQV